MTINEYNFRINKLREDWVKYPDNQRIIELQAKVLRMGYDELLKNDKDTQEIIETLF